MIYRPKILYVDDEADLLNLAAVFFEEDGLHLETSDCFLKAMGLIKIKSYDLIISDARMPSGNGKEFLSVIRKEKLFTGKCILLTGDLDYLADDPKHEFDLVLFKPTRFQDLVAHAQFFLRSKL